MFKRKQVVQNRDATSLLSYKPCYLYGFTENPNNVAVDKQQFGELYQKVIGNIGGIAINNSFHPYFIVNKKGTTVWNAAYVKIYVNENKGELFERIRTDNAIFTIDTASAFTEVNVWPDTRLTHEENPIFGSYVPFIIPFLVYDTEEEMRWDYEINKGLSEKGHATEYVESITNSIRFFMPEPAFVLGFDEFDEKNPSAMIDNFINCKQMLTGN